jgi:hypothetical protein
MSNQQPVKDRLTIVTTTHLLPSAPRVVVLKSTVDATRKHMNVAGCRHLVYYDQPADGGLRATTYLANLERLCESYGLELNVRQQSGLKKNLLEALEKITTPYIFFLEHDWAIKKRIQLELLLDVFDKYDYVNHVRFNMRNNDSCYAWDHLVEAEDRITELRLTRTSSWSNQAHIARMSKWRQDWLSVIGPEPSTISYGVEEKLYWAYNRDIFTKGFFEAHSEWGQYLYGGLHARPTVHHTNGRMTTASMLDLPLKFKRLIQRMAARRDSSA